MRRGIRAWAGVLGILVATGYGVGGAMAQSQGLSEAERQLAYRVEETALQQLRAAPNNPWVGKGIPQLARTPAGLVKKSVVTDVTLLGSPGTSSPGVRQALVTRYEYATGLTILTVVDLNAGAMIEVRAEANRPTPLAADEIQRAIALAGRAIPDLAVTPRSAVQILSVVQSKPTSRRYGHRLAVVWREGPSPSRRVLVDLTTEQVVEANF
jgi:hypothetical protein